MVAWIIVVAIICLVVIIAMAGNKKETPVQTTKTVPLVTVHSGKCSGCVFYYKKGKSDGCKKSYRCGRALSEYRDQYQSPEYEKIVRLRKLRQEKVRKSGISKRA